jgi:hypothetical protein
MAKYRLRIVRCPLPVFIPYNFRKAILKAMRDISKLQPAQVRHLFRKPLENVNGALTQEQKALIAPLKQDVFSVEKTVQQQAMQPGFITSVARLFSLM